MGPAPHLLEQSETEPEAFYARIVQRGIRMAHRLGVRFARKSARPAREVFVRFRSAEIRGRSGYGLHPRGIGRGIAAVGGKRRLPRPSSKRRRPLL